MASAEEGGDGTSDGGPSKDGLAGAGLCGEVACGVGLAKDHLTCVGCGKAGTCGNGLGEDSLSGVGLGGAVARGVVPEEDSLASIGHGDDGACAGDPGEGGRVAALMGAQPRPIRSGLEPGRLNLLACCGGARVALLPLLEARVWASCLPCQCGLSKAGSSGAVGRTCGVLRVLASCGLGEWDALSVQLGLGLVGGGGDL